jgi:hypothetical protein
VRRTAFCPDRSYAAERGRNAPSAELAQEIPDLLGRCIRDLRNMTHDHRQRSDAVRRLGQLPQRIAPAPELADASFGQQNDVLGRIEPRAR